jgi:hypothetical protein
MFGHRTGSMLGGICHVPVQTRITSAPEPTQVIRMATGPPSTDMCSELSRLNTFRCWPQSNVQRPAALARAGFYYLGQADRVRCAFCGGTLKSWQRGDEPMREHATHYPQCSLVQGVATRNVPLPMSETNRGPIQETHRGSPRSPSVVQQGSGEDTVPLREFSGLPLNPCHPDFELRAAREESFNNWSSGNHLGPHALAGAGFFYSGNAASRHNLAF